MSAEDYSRPQTGAESARRALRILLTFSEQAHTQTARDLANAVGVPLPSVHRYVALLRDESLLVEAGPGKYRLSPRVFALARAAEAAEPLVEIADPIMRHLSADTDETVLLVKLVGEAAVCVHRIETKQLLRLSFQPGQVLPLMHGASAKILLSGIPAAERRRYLGTASAAQVAELNASVDLALRRGWASSSAEIEDGVWAAAAAVLDGDKAIAALTIPCPMSRMPVSRQKSIIKSVREGAAELTKALQERSTNANSLIPPRLVQHRNSSPPKVM